MSAAVALPRKRARAQALQPGEASLCSPLGRPVARRTSSSDHSAQCLPAEHGTYGFGVTSDRLVGAACCNADCASPNCMKTEAGADSFKVRRLRVYVSTQSTSFGCGGS